MRAIMKGQGPYSARKLLYTSAFSQSFSPCGKYLAVGDSHGHIHLFSLITAITPDAGEENWVPVSKFQAQKSDSPVYALQSTETFLISAGTGPIRGWLWTDIINQQNIRIAWEIKVDFQQKDIYEEYEINALAVKFEEHEHSLVAGGGDGNVYLFDLENGSLKRRFKGHRDYIHCVDSVKDCGLLVSGSEDGLVRMWDERTGDTVHMCDPSTFPDVARPDKGRFISCLDTHNDWLVCGGGPSLSLWQLRTLSPFSVFHTPRSSPYWATFNDDTIVSVGSEPTLFNWAVNGDVLWQTSVSPTHCFNVAVNRIDNKQVMTVAGNKYKVDVLINPGYTSFSLELR